MIVYHAHGSCGYLCSSTPGPSLSHSPGPVSNKSKVWKKEGSVASKVM